MRWMKRTVTISGRCRPPAEGMPMDPYWCSEGISLKSKMKVGVYPTWSYNFEDLVVGIGAGAISKTSIRQQISHAEKTIRRLRCESDLHARRFDG